jgi:hypothetical protein
MLPYLVTMKAGCANIGNLSVNGDGYENGLGGVMFMLVILLFLSAIFLGIEAGLVVCKLVRPSRRISGQVQSRISQLFCRGVYTLRLLAAWTTFLVVYVGVVFLAGLALYYAVR